MGSGHRLLFGVAGAGKTVVLVARAKFLSEALPSRRILVLCFNVSFRTYLGALLRPCPNVDVYTFHGWGSHNGVRWQEDELPGHYGARLLDALEANRGDSGCYDAVLIDEAQDFDPVWFACAKAALREPMTGDFLIVGDRNQTSYHRAAVSWKSLRINAVGRTRVLRRNYRNSKAILTAAAPFADNSETDDGIAAAAPALSSAVRMGGATPLLVRCSNRNAEVLAVIDFVKSLLVGAGPTPTSPFAPHEIGILYRKKDACLPDLIEGLKRISPTLWLSEGATGQDARQRVLEPGVKVQTIHSAKGLEYRAVILVFADQLGLASGDEDKDRRLLYVALTRAQEILMLSCCDLATGPRSRLLDTMMNSGAFRIRTAGTWADDRESNQSESQGVAMNKGFFKLVGLDEGGVAGRPDNLRLVCVTDDGRKVAVWGSEGQRANIDAVLKKGLPCTIEAEWREPNPMFAERFGHSCWVRQDFDLSVIE